MERKIKLAAVAGLSLAAMGATYAAQATANDALGISSAKTSLTQAITAAEQHVGGVASRAEFEHEKGLPVFEIEIVKGQAVVDVRVDPTSGKILSAKNDERDHDGDRHERDDEGSAHHKAK